MAMPGILVKALPHIARRMQNELVLTAPRDGGRLWTTIKVIPSGKGLLISMAIHGKYVEFGTPPHIIKPKKAGGLLHWHKTKGRNQHSHPHSKEMAKDAVFAKQVKHPGTRPNPFVRTAIQTN